MRFATYNIEWFDALFSDTGKVLDDHEWSARHDITRHAQVKAIAHVLQAIDADAVMIIEAPDQNRVRRSAHALQSFAMKYGLRTRKAVIGFANATQQEIALLYDPDVMEAVHDPITSTKAPQFDQSLQIDLNMDGETDDIVFSKPPLELAVRLKSGAKLRLIGAHLKSKAPHGAGSEDELIQLSIQNRRKQLAQAIWIRRRIEHHLNAGDSIMVMGDMNDGPGLDIYEDLFGKSSVELLLGEGDQALFDPHANQALYRRLGATPTTSRFYIKGEQRYLTALLDYIMISSGLMDQSPQWRIWHPFDDARCWKDDQMRKALLIASDHFPVTLDLDLKGL